MWDTASLDVKSYRGDAVLSHISRNTSEMWATHHLLQI
jgi:hypothetical protein